MHRGDWAGDRFRIVTTGVFKYRTTDEQWEDVSARTAEWLRDILRSEDEHQNGNRCYKGVDGGSNEN